MTRPWAIMPVLSEPYTDQAIVDVLRQTVEPNLLIINQGVDTPYREHLERCVEAQPDRLFLWSHVPPLPSLAATWNRGLQFVWETGAEEALVVNNDVRLDPRTMEILSAVLTWPKEHALFVTAVGVTEAQFAARPDPLFDLKADDNPLGPSMPLGKGGPDFSCFLISKAAHEQYPFDENFVPAYCEDLDTHRRYMLGGDGDKIFSVNLPYLHYASGTLKALDDEKRVALQRRIGQSRAYYEQKWGGPVNQERYTIPFDASTAQDGVTTPQLQRKLQEPACT